MAAAPHRMPFNFPTSGLKTPTQDCVLREPCNSIYHDQGVTAQLYTAHVLCMLTILVPCTERHRVVQVAQWLDQRRFQPCTEKEATEPRHLVSAIKLHGVVALCSGKIVRPSRVSVVAVSPCIA